MEPSVNDEYVKSKTWGMEPSVYDKYESSKTSDMAPSLYDDDVYASSVTLKLEPGY